MGALGGDASEILCVERDRLGLRPEAVSVDVEDFNSAIEAGDLESLDRARGLYRGPFLLGLETGAALATVVGVLVEVPVMLSLVAFANRTQRHFG